MLGFSLSLLVLLICEGNRTAVHALHDCDETRCRNERVHPWVDDDYEFTCWVSTTVSNEELADPSNGYCTKGYVGRLVKEVLPTVVDDELRRWYTCCTPEYTGEITQTCSDTACSSPDWAGGGNCWADGFQEPMSCGDREFRYPRFTGMQSLIYVQYLCCTSPHEDSYIMQELHIARIFWVLLSCITLVVCTIFMVAILSFKHTRDQSYNLYLVFLAFPDAIANLMIIIRNSLIIPGAPVSPTWFVFLASFEYFYAAANMWLNAVIVKQIYTALCMSNHRQRIPPPTKSLVYKQTGVVYGVALIFFAWSFFLYHNGLIAFSLETVVNIWIATRAIIISPPLFYVLYVCYDVWHRKLLPIAGRTRVLSLYFLRVIVVFLVTWVPYFIIYEISWNATHSRTMVYISYYLGSIQGTISVLVAMQKPDVKKAIERFCKCDVEYLKRKQEDHDTDETASGLALSTSQALRISQNEDDRTDDKVIGRQITAHLEKSAWGDINYDEWEAEDVWPDQMLHSVKEEDEEEEDETRDTGEKDPEEAQGDKERSENLKDDNRPEQAPPKEVTVEKCPWQKAQERARMFLNERQKEHEKIAENEKMMRSSSHSQGALTPESVHDDGSQFNDEEEKKAVETDTDKNSSAFVRC